MIGIYARKVGDIWFGVACDDMLVFAADFGKNRKTVIDDLVRCLPPGSKFEQNEKLSVLAGRALSVVEDIYDGKDVSEVLDLAVSHLSSYMQKVIRVTSAIPAGYVASYGSISKTAGGAPRAVGGVMASHPFPPIVPCHRVVAWDLSLGGYGGGLDMKREFLMRERRGFKEELDIVVNGKKLHVFPVEFVLTKMSKK